MADAFRGLTIRLGADVRPLNSAINSVISHTRKAQAQFNALEKSLKISPANTRAAQLAMDLLGDKALLAGRAVHNIQSAMSQVSDKTKSLAGATKNVYAAVHKNKEEYKHVDAELQRVYDRVTQIRAAELRAKDGTLAMADSIKLAKQEVDKLRAGYGKVADKTKELDRLLRIGNTKGLGTLFDTKGKPEKLIEKVKALRAEHSALNRTASELKRVEGYKAMEMQLISWKAKLKEAAMEAARFRSEMYSINAGPGVAKLTERISRIDSEIDQATASAKRLDEAFKKAPRSIELARAKLIAEKSVQESLNDKASALREILDAIPPHIKEIANSTKNVHKWVSELEHDWSEVSQKEAAAQAAVDRFTQELREAKNIELIGPKRSIETIEHDLKEANAELTEARIKAHTLDEELRKANAARRYRQAAEDLNVLEAEMTQARTKASALRRALDFSKTIRTAGYGLYSTLTPAIMIAGRYAIQSARNIDAAYRDMRKTVNGTEEDFEHLRDAALEFSTTHFTSAEQILEIEAMGGQLGIAVSDLEAFAETISNLDVATNVDANTAAEQLGKMATVLGITVDEYDNFGDALVRLGNNMPVMESDILTLTTRFMGMGKVVGMQPDEMLAWAAAASATGQKAEAAGSAMQRFIAKMETAVVGGGDVLEQWASVAHMTGDEFAAAFNEDASKAMYAFIEGLGDIQREGGSVNQVLQDLKINNVRDKQLLEGLAVQAANAGDGFSELEYALKLSSDAYHGLSTVTRDGAVEEAGDAAREAGKKAAGFSGQIEMMIHDAQLLAQELAEGALPFVNLLADGFKSATEVVAAMPPEMKSLIVGILGVAAALGPLAVGFGAAGAAVDFFLERAAMSAGARTIKGIATGISSLGGILAKSASATFPLAAAAIGKVGAKITALAGIAASAAPLFVLLAVEVALIAKTFIDAHERAERFRNATEGVSQAVKRAQYAYRATADSVKSYGNEAVNAAERMDKLLESQEKFVNTMNENARVTEEQCAELDALQGVLDEYMNTTNDAAGQIKLINAVNTLNEKYGTQYKVVDAANGKIADEKGVLLDTASAIDDYIWAKKKQIEADQLAADSVAADQALSTAVSEYVAAAKEYNDYAAKYGEWFGDENAVDAMGHSIRDTAKILDDARKQAAEIVSVNQEAKDAIDSQWKVLAEGSKEASGSVAALAQQNGILQEVFDDETTFAVFRSELEKTGIGVEDFKNLTAQQLGDIVAAWNDGEADLADVLSGMGISVNGAKEEMVAAFSKMDVDWNSFVQDFGGNADALMEKFGAAGISASTMASLSEESIKQALSESGGNIDTFIAKLQELSAQNVSVEAELNVIADEATAEVDQFSDEVENVPDGDSEIDYSSYEEAEDQAVDTGEAIEGIPESKTVTVNVNGNALNTLSSIKSYLDNLPSEKTVTVRTNEVKNASGGLTNGPIRTIPRHADGGINGIVTHPTLTNIGWVGEAGAEALLHMRHAGGAVIPLSNRRYVRPFARAVASEMTGGHTANSYDYHITVNASGDGDDIARQVTKAIKAQELMRGRR